MIQVTDTHVFFYTEWPSNFFRAYFDYASRFNGQTHKFFCTEQAFMYEKAVVFGDQDAASKILAAYTPAEAKQLGRTVRNFDTDTWEKYRYEVMRDVNLEKYRQNPDLAKRLLDTRFDGRKFVEASPVDSIWGILMPMGAPGIDDEANWRGRNLLGKAITEVRDILKGEACSK
jgi:hypothetical protein